MTTENKDKAMVQVKSQHALDAMASRLQVSRDQLYNTLKKTAFRECTTNEDFLAGLVVANTYQLNPLLKEMTVFGAKGGGVVPVVMVDGWISLVNRSPEYDGVELIENKCAVDDKVKDPSGSGVESVTAVFYLKNRSHAIKVTEYMRECYNANKEPWKKWPIRMLRHKAYIQGARIAFGFSGIYDEDEKDRIIQAQGVVVDEGIVSLNNDKGKGNSPVTSPTPPETAEKPVQEAPGDANDVTPGVRPEDQAIAEGKPQDTFKPSSSSLANTSKEILRAELRAMLLYLADGDVVNAGVLCCQQTKFKDHAGYSDPNEIPSTPKEGKRCMLEVTHSKVKKMYEEATGEKAEE